jgi:hypothetical protein
VSPTYLALLASVSMAILASRLLFRGIPLPGVASRLSALDAIVLTSGIIALVIHCGAMFFRSRFRSFPEGHWVIRTVDPLGTSSIFWFALAALLVLVGLRRQGVVVSGVVGASLAAVGITMYDGGSIHTHLAAIFVAVVVLAGVIATVVIPPWRSRPLSGELSTPPT